MRYVYLDQKNIQDGPVEYLLRITGDLIKKLALTYGLYTKMLHCVKDFCDCEGIV